MNWKVCAVVLLGLAFGISASAQEHGGLIFEVGDAITIGNFKYQDAKVDIEKTFFNPQGSVEYYFPGRWFSLGAQYAQSKNGYDLAYTKGEKRLDGSLDVERKSILPYIRFGEREFINLRIGLNMFDYEFTDGNLDEFRNGAQTKQIRDGYAKGKLSTGIDAELSLLFGDKVQFGLMLGGTYFMGAQYDWHYRDDLNGGTVTTGTAKLDAVSLRLAPELSFAVANGWRIFARYQISGTSWIGNKDDEDEDYAGVDVMAAAVVGLRVDLGF